MTRYLLDTNILIDFSKQREPEYSRLLALIAAGEDIAVCDVVIAEFFAGLQPTQRTTWTAFFAECRFLVAGRDAAAQSGIYRYDFARRGRTLALGDSLIAAIAREHDAVVISKNGRDFPMTDITLIAELPVVATENGRDLH